MNIVFIFHFQVAFTYWRRWVNKKILWLFYSLANVILLWARYHYLNARHRAVSGRDKITDPINFTLYWCYKLVVADIENFKNLINKNIILFSNEHSYNNINSECLSRVGILGYIRGLVKHLKGEIKI